MKYFTQAYIDFFSELENNNQKAWFDENRKRYEKHVKEPFKAFINELIIKVQEFEPDLQVLAKDTIFRINRDIRFSKNKTPYKVHMAANLARGGRKSYLPGYYIQLSASQVMLGGGVYFSSKEKNSLYKVRSEISYETEKFNQIVNAPAFKDTFGEVLGDKNKRLPSEFQDTLQEQPLIANKQFYYMKKLDPQLITDENLVTTVADYLQVGAPLNQFFKMALEEIED